MIDVDDINEAWGWVGMSAVEVLGANAFGNLIIRDEDDHFWCLRPQELVCEPLARSRAALDALAYNQIPSALGGHYGCDNLATVPLAELIRFAGEGAQQFEGLPRWN